MLKFQTALIMILITCLTFVSCDRAQNALKPVTDGTMDGDDTMPDDDMMMDMMKMLDSTMYMSWAHVMLPAPGEHDDAMNPAETGGVHGMGTRTVYINEIGTMANKDGTMYPAETVIVKTIMDDANTFVAKKAVMQKTADPMYADHGGWMYVKYARSSADGEYEMVGGGSVEKSMGCHGCHAKAGTEGASGHDSVFVSLSMGDDMDHDMSDDMDHDMSDDMGDDMGDDMSDDMDHDMGDDMDHDMGDDMHGAGDAE